MSAGVRRLLSRLRHDRGAHVDDLLRGPIQGDLLGAEHLAERARALAREQQVTVPSPLGYRAKLLSRLNSTIRVLDTAYTRLTRESTEGGDTDPAGEWLLDNFHVVQEHIQEVRASLPRGFYRELPELASGPLAGYPRIYEIAITLISHSEARIDLDNVDHFVESFQETEPLRIGELWAMPAMLRLALIESIRRMSLRTMRRLDEIASADRWVKRVMEHTDRQGDRLVRTLGEMLQSPGRLTPTFVTRFLADLRLASGASPALAHVEDWLRHEGIHPDEAASRATHRMVHTQLTMGNSITSLRTIGRRDWRGFVERQSAMDAVLREDPAGAYARMTFATRDRYRHVVEQLARRARMGETDVAREAIGLAAAATHSEHTVHVGFWLVDGGLPELERTLGVSPPPDGRLIRWIRRNPDLVLVGGLILLTLLAMMAVNLLAGTDIVRVSWPVILPFVFLPAWDIAINTINQLVTAVLPPYTPPSLDLREGGIPREFHTVVAVPTLFGSEADVQSALDHLEVVALANDDGALHFVILSDFTDAPQEVMPTDQAILDAAAAGIAALNQRHPHPEGDRFLLLHRPRRWNAQQDTWMGWERKRGKLTEFNRVLRGQGREAFSFVSGDLAALQTVRYVITLDADTILPPGSAQALTGTIAHPLNRARYDPELGRVVRGYSILQPRVGISLPSAQHSRFAEIQAGHPGVDPYTTAVSDVYQDLYGEGIFTGKGIYDVDAFTLATRGRFPENTLLSHDLIEGNYARAGLITGITVYDDVPTGYIAHSRRKHRWIRGDWQLLPWLGRWVPGPDGKERNRLSLVSRWKILDNLRRSTVEMSQLALLLAGWTVLAGSPVRWTLLALGAIAAPWIVSSLIAALRPPRDKSWRAYYASVFTDAVHGARQFVLAVVFLPHQVWVSADAIVRTLFRMFVSRRHLLEWTTAAQVAQQHRNTVAEHWREMLPAILAVTGIALWVLIPATIEVRAGRDSWFHYWMLVLAVAPFTLVWIASPWIATWLGPAAAVAEPLDADLRDTARRYVEAHWHWFDRYATAETHWLAPDNVQFDPVEVVAMRTSPTNIGLQLLATMSAGDLGLIDARDVARRIELIFGTLARMDRYQGHFYNWYSLDDLHVLQPPYISSVDSGNLAGHLLALRQGCLHYAAHSDDPALAARFHALAERAWTMADEMRFAFLHDEQNRLLSIGYHPDSHSLDAGCYDLLASEARLAAFVAIAKDELPTSSWFRLGRRLIRAEGRPMMVSWSGSMFEYLMPLLVMRSYPGTLLDQSHRGAVRAQIGHGRDRGVPWGVSESAYNIRDKDLTYQYRAFGVPELALKRGLARDLVIAPYATALAAMVKPVAALRNLMSLEQHGALGPYGFWDALDYTRPSPGMDFAMVQTVMAHHAGMTVVALTNVLLDDIWQDRFHSETLVRANELLLQERTPRKLVVQDPPRVPAVSSRRSVTAEDGAVRHFSGVDSPAPRIALLGDIPYTVMMTHAGGGWSRHDRMAVTRWRSDPTRDNWGQFCYVRDLAESRTWSAGFQPTGAHADSYDAEFAADRVTITRRDGKIETRTEVAVVAAESAEVRRVTITNHSHRTRELELTSYAELALGPADADAAHPAFANLFVETEWHEWCSAITARRRPRQPDQVTPWYVHLVDAGAGRVGRASCETDRARFIGRGRSTARPIALEHDGDLSGTTGAVLDPIAAIRVRISVEPGESVSVAFTTLIVESREKAFELADRYHDSQAIVRAFDVAWMASQIDLREAELTPADAATIEELAGHILFPHDVLRPASDDLERSRGSQSTLWNHGISGDLPILLVTIKSVDGLPTARELFVAHRYLRRHGLQFDLVVIVAEAHDYLQQLKLAITEAMIAASDATLIDQPGGVFIRRRDAFDSAEYQTLLATAGLVIPCDGRPVARILANALNSRQQQAPPSRHSTQPRRLLPPEPPRLQALPGGNGHGALEVDGSYRMIIHGDHLPPAPWVNVIANPDGGCIVSERGTGVTWSSSAYFYRLTPWHNDPVSDPPCDVIYIQDASSGDLWSATPAPLGGNDPFEVIHSPGVSTFRHGHGDIACELTIGAPDGLAGKLSLLRLTNEGSNSRTLAITCYSEWVLGVRREITAPHVRTWLASDGSAILARNRFEGAFAERVAFLKLTTPVTSATADRAGFLGRHGSLENPAALTGAGLDNNTGVSRDPCAALQSIITLEPGQSFETAVVLGSADDEQAAHAVLQGLDSTAECRSLLEKSVRGWRDRLGVIQVRTPSADLDAMLNTWALYQGLASRMWARTGLYQSSGAYGFRDQLQDVMAFVYAEPMIAREHLLRAASRQFIEGDVQHWWHPHSGNGVRTRFSDDLAWLPFVADHYVRTTGDDAILDEVVPFIEMRQLEPHEHEIYQQPQVSDQRASLYEHCIRALRRACTRGPHGLPLIGGGDWNDGFSRIGIEGRGESVWLAWFLITTCTRMARHASNRGDDAVASELLSHVADYSRAVEQHAWDGEWYRRAWFDDGTPLGTAGATACEIDSIAQSWSVISGAGSSERQRTAMASLRRKLVDHDARLIKLLTPPFDHDDLDPGYIRGYLPGVRENGAQYTHGALWAVQAMALLGDGEQAWEMYQMLIPFTHADTPEAVEVYRVEPYVVAADVYTALGHRGRGGWTWYTGSASWMYRVGLESLLGFTLRGDTLSLSPCVPESWPEFTIDYRRGASRYTITVRRPAQLRVRGTRISVDGQVQPGDSFRVTDDGRDHVVTIEPRDG